MAISNPSYVHSNGVVMMARNYFGFFSQALPQDASLRPSACTLSYHFTANNYRCSFSLRLLPVSSSVALNHARNLLRCSFTWSSSSSSFYPPRLLTIAHITSKAFSNFSAFPFCFHNNSSGSSSVANAVSIYSTARPATFMTSCCGSLMRILSNVAHPSYSSAAVVNSSPVAVAVFHKTSDLEACVSLYF